MEKKDKILIGLSVESEDEINHAAERLKNEIGDDVEVNVQKEPAEGMTGRSTDITWIMPMIEVIFVGAQTCVMVAQYLDHIKQKRPVIENPETGRKVKIKPDDTTREIESKVKKVMTKPGFLERLFRRR